MQSQLRKPKQKHDDGKTACNNGKPCAPLWLNGGMLL
jgi:hypothetical protein